MDIEYMENRKVKITLEDYIKERIDDFKDDVEGTATTPADKRLFVINEYSPRLSKEKHENFHSIVAKLLFVSKRARLDHFSMYPGIMKHRTGLEEAFETIKIPSRHNGSTPNN